MKQLITLMTIVLLSTMGFYGELQAQASCAIGIVSVKPTNCTFTDPGNTYDLIVEVNYINGPGGTINVEVLGNVYPFTSNDSGFESFTIMGIQLTGATDVDVMASFANDAVCTITKTAAYDECSPSKVEFICPGDTVDLVAQAGLSSYQWYKDGVAVPSPEGTSSTLTTSDIGEYTYTAKDASGCDINLFCPIPVPLTWLYPKSSLLRLLLLWR